MTETPSLLEEIEQFDVNDLELGEAVELEEALGSELGEIDWTSAKAMLHLVWIMRRRQNPDYTLDDAKRIKLTEFEEPNGNGAARPTKAAAKKPAGKRASGGRRS